MVFTDREDRILVTDLVTGATGEVSVEHRFFAPFFTPSGSIVSPSLDGGIWLFDGEEAISVGPGDSPAWWVEEDRLVFIRTTDDGQRLLTSDLWSWNREEGAVRLSETPDVLETSPTPVAGGIYYVDAASDRPGFLEAAPK